MCLWIISFWKKDFLKGIKKNLIYSSNLALFSLNYRKPIIMKIVKRIFLVVFILFILLIGAIVAIPIFFKDDIVAKTKEEINKTVYAKVDFKEVDLSLLSTFPNLGLSINDFTVEGIDDFEGVRLASGEAINLSLDLFSVFNSSKPIAIKSVALQKPNLHIYVLENGKANYDIAVPTDERIKESAQEGDFSQFVVKLQEYNITNGSLIYDDRATDVFFQIDQLEHSGSGNFTIDVYDLDTQSEIGELTVKQGGITFLNKAKATLDAIINIDQKNSKYTLKDNNLLVNALKINADGFVQLKEEDILMDIDFNTPQNEFKHLLSMIPNAYIQGYEQVKADGRFALVGNVKGTYNGIKEVYPGFKVDFKIDEANIKYPDLPLGIDNINANISVNSPSQDLDDLVVNAQRFSMKVGNNPFDAKFKLETPISNPDVDAIVNGVIDLEQISKAFPMEGMEALNGVITTNLRTRAKMSQIDRQDYENVDMRGDFKLENFKYQSEEFPMIRIQNMDMDFSPQEVTLEQFDANLGKSDLKASGKFDNILAYFSPKKTMTGNLRVRSNHFYADEWIPTPEPSAEAPTPPATTYTPGEIFDRFDFSIDAKVNQLDYDVYKIKDGIAAGSFTPKELKVSRLEGKIGDSDFSAKGNITNVFDYLFENGILGGNISLSSQKLNLNQFMTEDGSAPSANSASTEALEPVPIPENIKMTVNADIDRLVYTNIELRDIKGKLNVENQAVILEDATANALGGKMGVSGSYDTKDKDNPGFSFKYNLQSLDFQEAFNTLNTFQAIAPIGQFIEGEFNSTLIIDGKLGKDLMPQLSTLSAEGFLHTLKGTLKNFKPLESVANAINISALKETIRLTDTKNWFELKDGAVEIKEFDHKIKDIDLKIGGRHSLTQEMNYNIGAKIPRKLLEKNAVGSAASSGFNVLQKQASKLGVNIKQGEFVNVGFTLTGSITDPKVKFKLLGMDGETSLADAAEASIKEELDNQKEKLQDAAEEKVEEGKEIVQEKVDAVKDSVSTVIEEKVEETKDKVTEEAGNIVKDKLGSSLDSTTQNKVEDILGGKGKEGVDKIKDNLDKFNPFKKKKKKKEGGN